MSFVNGLYIYSQKYYQFYLTQIKQIIANNPKVTPSMFSHLDILHLSGHSNFQKFLSKYPLNTSSKVFQIGCGLGGTTRFLVQQTGCFVHAIDFLSHYIQLAKIITQSTNQLSNISYNQGDINTYPIQENKYDLAFQIGVFEVIKELDGYKTIAKSLRQGGLFYFQDYFLLKYLQDLGVNDRARLKNFDIENVKTKDVIFQALERNGLELVEFIDISAKWSEAAWIRAEGIQEDWKSGKDSNPEAARRSEQHGCTVPGLMRNLDHISDSELQKRFPLTLEAVGGLDAVREPNTLSATSMVWRKK